MSAAVHVRSPRHFCALGFLAISVGFVVCPSRDPRSDTTSLVSCGSPPSRKILDIKFIKLHKTQTRQNPNKAQISQYTNLLSRLALWILCFGMFVCSLCAVLCAFKRSAF